MEQNAWEVHCLSAGAVYHTYWDRNSNPTFPQACRYAACLSEMDSVYTLKLCELKIYFNIIHKLLGSDQPGQFLTFMLYKTRYFS